MSHDVRDDNEDIKYLSAFNDIKLMLAEKINNCFWPDRHYMPVTQCE